MKRLNLYYSLNYSRSISFRKVLCFFLFFFSCNWNTWEMWLILLSGCWVLALVEWMSKSDLNIWTFTTENRDGLETLCLCEKGQNEKTSIPLQERANIYQYGNGRIERLQTKHGNNSLLMGTSKSFKYKGKSYLVSFQRLRDWNKNGAVKF